MPFIMKFDPNKIIIIPIEGHGYYKPRVGDIPKKYSDIPEDVAMAMPTREIPPTAKSGEFFIVPHGIQIVSYTNFGRKLFAQIAYEIFRFFLEFPNQSSETKAHEFNKSGLILDRHGQLVNIVDVRNTGSLFESLVLQNLEDSEIEISEAYYRKIYSKKYSTSQGQFKYPYYNMFAFDVVDFFASNPRKPNQSNCYLSEVIEYLTTILQKHIKEGYTIQLHLMQCREAEGDPFVEKRSLQHLTTSRTRQTFDISKFINDHYQVPGWVNTSLKTSLLNIERLPRQLRKTSQIFSDIEVESSGLPSSDFGWASQTAVLSPDPVQARLQKQDSFSPRSYPGSEIIENIKKQFIYNNQGKPHWGLTLAVKNVKKNLKLFLDALKQPDLKSKDLLKYNLEQAIQRLSETAGMEIRGGQNPQFAQNMRTIVANCAQLITLYRTL